LAILKASPVRATLPCVDAAVADAVAELRGIVKPEPGTTTPEAVAHLHGQLGEPLFRLVRRGGRPVAYLMCGIMPGREADPSLWFDVGVLPEHRRRGIGSALYAEVSRHATSLRRAGLACTAREDGEDALEFLDHRGFAVVDRLRKLALDLAGLELPAADPPAGISLVTYAERPELAAGMYEVYREAVGDVPGEEADRDLSFEEWRAEEIDAPDKRPELIFVALAGDRVVGVGGLEVPSAGDARNGFLAVARSHRRRGVGRAIKSAELAAAKRAGIPRLVTSSPERNEPMLRLNRSLGYRAIPGLVVLRGPLAVGNRVRISAAVPASR